MKTISKKQVEAIIANVTGQKYCAEDKRYQLLPESFFDATWAQRTLGLKQWFYVEEGFDCDNFADKFRGQIKDRYWRKYVKKQASARGVASYPDVFVECVKVMYPDARLPHWFVCAICDNGSGEPKLIFRERTSCNIVTPPQGYSIFRVK